jgi:hypothetical protein
MYIPIAIKGLASFMESQYILNCPAVNVLSSFLGVNVLSTFWTTCSSNILWQQKLFLFICVFHLERMYFVPFVGPVEMFFVPSPGPGENFLTAFSWSRKKCSPGRGEGCS